MNKLLVTVCYVGLLKPAPGTWGSLAGILLFLPIHMYGGPFLLITLTILISIVGIFLVKKATETREDKDPSQIVIDEVAGQWISLLPVSFGAHSYRMDLIQVWPWLLLAFILFRFFDIVKLGPVKWADDRNDALGVMLDDIFAGFIVALMLIIIAWFYYGY
ncbi:MAG: phosphatidylglycerophosphatase A [Paracoccaceae bacterium]|nr:phosphatidylglycerophosphatase A [Paracoccaceae bacterium]